MKVISFSLWGDSPKYIQGALRNIKLAQEHYPDGWTCCFFVPPGNVDICNRLNLIHRESSKILNVPIWVITPDWCPPMFGRFLIADFPDVERFIVRDTDSRIGPEEAAACADWIKDDTVLWTARAHPAHARPINGGMWGGVWRRDNWGAPSMADMLQEYLGSDDYKNYGGHDHDQHFLCTRIWPWAKASATQHDMVCRGAYPGSKPFPVKWPWPRFMGEVWEVNEDGTEQPRAKDWEAIQK